MTSNASGRVPGGPVDSLFVDRIAEEVDDEPVGHHHPHVHLAAVARAERVETEVGAICARRVVGAGWQPDDVVGEREPGRLLEEQLLGELDVVQHVGGRVDRGYRTDRERSTCVVDRCRVRRCSSGRQSVAGVVAGVDDVALGAVGDDVGDGHLHRHAHHAGCRVDGVGAGGGDLELGVSLHRGGADRGGDQASGQHERGGQKSPQHPDTVPAARRTAGSQPLRARA
jgi:hypothetical protein